jgi:hypothetical protein
MSSAGSSTGTGSIATGGAGNSTGTGGAGGRSIARIDMFSDFEPGNDVKLNRNDKWQGLWLVDSDQSIPDQRPRAIVERLSPMRRNADGSESTQAYHITNDVPRTGWGSAWLTRFFDGHAVDLSGYTGITFWARSDGETATTIKFGLADQGSYPTVRPPETQLCDEFDVSGGRGCYDHYSVKIAPGAEWTRYEIPFSVLTTEGWGLPHAFDPSKVYMIVFFVGPADTYSEWLDDVAFYKE